MGVFRWISDAAIPPALDLRSLGWALAPHDDGSWCISILPASDIAEDAALMSAHPEARLHIIVGGVNQTDERARFLAQGFGEVVGDAVTLTELDMRARRLLELRNWLPRRRVIAGLELDLLIRDALIAGRPVGLKPREFELLWRLADSPEEPVSRQTLVHDVLRLRFEPASNSINVHMSRLRAKLHEAGLQNLVETISGGYRLCLPAMSYPAGVQAPWAAGLPPSGSADPRWS